MADIQAVFAGVRRRMILTGVIAGLLLFALRFSG